MDLITIVDINLALNTYYLDDLNYLKLDTSFKDKVKCSEKEKNLIFLYQNTGIKRNELLVTTDIKLFYGLNS